VIEGEFVSDVRLVRSSRLSSVAEYAYASVVPADAQLVLCAGACPLDLSGATVGKGDVRAQARQVMSNLEIALAEAGATLADVVRTTVYVASAEQRDLVAAWQVVRASLAPHEPPGTLLGVAALGYDDQLVEVDAIAVTAGRPVSGTTPG
jgi:enamine deaminase RidA (YjgF/YER057c/UK114 family)